MAMLREANVQQVINYVNAPGERIPIVDNSIDVVTMAGSLNYIDREILVSELKRICRRNAEIVIYDFEIDLSNFETLFKLENVNGSLEYNHLANLAEFAVVEETLLVRDEVLLNLESHEIAHLLLSDTGWHSVLQEMFCTQDLFESVKTEIETTETMFTLKANIYYSLYSMSES